MYKLSVTTTEPAADGGVRALYTRVYESRQTASTEWRTFNDFAVNFGLCIANESYRMTLSAWNTALSVWETLDTTEITDLVAK